MHLLAQVAQFFSQFLSKWIKKRVPANTSLVLDHKKIFILPTRYGFTCILILIALFLGGVNYSNSLILLATFWLTGMCIVSILHTHNNLYGLHIKSETPNPVPVGQPVLFKVILTHARSRYKNNPKKRSHDAIKLYWKHIPGTEVSVLKDRQEICYLSVPTSKRGVLKPGRLCIETTYPVGLLRAWAWVDLEMACCVYPDPKVKSQQSMYAQTADHKDLSNDKIDNRMNQLDLGADDFDGLKSYQIGDPLKHVHWKTYARTGVLHSKNFISVKGEDRWLDWKDFESFSLEKSLSLLSYWVHRLQHENCQYGLKMPNGQVDIGAGNHHQRQCLELLSHYQGPTFDELGRVI